MCGRFTREMSWADVVAFSRGLDLAVPAEDPAPSWNVCPTQSSPVLRAGEGGTAIVEDMRWGLLPPWAKDAKIGASMINARLETVAEKPAFRNAWKQRHCLVPISSYYEWRMEGGIKQPYRIHQPGSRVLMLAGLWERWKAPDGEWLHSFATITCAAVDPMAQLHDRTPLILPPDEHAGWLHGDAAEAARIAARIEPPPLEWYPVSRAVSSPRNDDPRLIEPVAPASLF
jgi:putative SOS response-associated peptidase YedK